MPSSQGSKIKEGLKESIIHWYKYIILFSFQLCPILCNLKAVCLSPMWTGIWSFPNYDSSCVWQIFKELSSFKWKGFKRNSLTAGRITLHVLFIDSWFHPPNHPKGVSEHLLCTSHVSDARDTVKHKCNIPTFIYFPLIDATEEWTNSCIT